MIDRKNLGLLILILVVSGVVAVLNPRFLSPVNLSNTANLIGLFASIVLMVLASLAPQVIKNQGHPIPRR